MYVNDNASSSETVPTTPAVHMPSIYAGFEHLIFGAARDSSTVKADRQRDRTRFFDLDADAVFFFRPRVAPRPFRFVAPAPRAETVIVVPAG